MMKHPFLTFPAADPHCKRNSIWFFHVWFLSYSTRMDKLTHRFLGSSIFQNFQRYEPHTLLSRTQSLHMCVEAAPWPCTPQDCPIHLEGHVYADVQVKNTDRDVRPTAGKRRQKKWCCIVKHFLWIYTKPKLYFTEKENLLSTLKYFNQIGRRVSRTLFKIFQVIVHLLKPCFSKLGLFCSICLGHRA